jgi:hypothetical protein
MLSKLLMQLAATVQVCLSMMTESSVPPKLCLSISVDS